MNIGKHNDKLRETHKDRRRLLTSFITTKAQGVNKTWFIFVT